jgi:flagellar biosynthetic protein FlhB
MPDESHQERTEQATPRRREEARRRGQVASSQEVVSVVVLGAGLVALNALGPALVERLGRFAGALFANAGAVSLDGARLRALGLASLAEVGLALAPFTAVVAIAGIAGNLVQTGFLFAPGAVSPRLDRIDPAARVRALLGGRGLVESVKTLLKVLAVAGAATLSMRGEIDRVLALSWGGVAAGYAGAWSIAFGIGLRILAVLALVAALDYRYQRWRHERDLRMSRQELRDEQRQQEGDPLVKARVRSIQRETARRRMTADVASADAVVASPTRTAVALRYESGSMDAPVLVAKGKRRIAERIEGIARENGVPVIESPALARAIHESVRVGRPIPARLYRPVAEMLALALRRKGRVA